MAYKLRSTFDDILLGTITLKSYSIDYEFFNDMK